MGNGCFSRNPSAQRVRPDHACAARRRQAGADARHHEGCLAEMCRPRPVCPVRARRGPCGSFHRSTRCAAKGSSSVRCRSTPEEKTFPRTETLWRSLSKTLVPTNLIRIYSLRGEPQKDVVVENATALEQSRLGRHRSRLLLHRPNAKRQRTPVHSAGRHIACAVVTSRNFGRRRFHLPTALISPCRDGLGESNAWMLTDF